MVLVRLIMRNRAPLEGGHTLTSRPAKSWMVAGLLLVLLWVPTASARAESLLDRLRQQETKQHNQVITYEQQAEQAGQSLAKMQSKIQQTQALIATQEQSLNRLNAEIEEKNRQLSLLRQQQNEALVQLYEMGDPTIVQLVLRPDTLVDYANQTEYLAALESRLAQLVQSVVDLTRDLQHQQQVQEHEHETLSLARSRQTAQLSTIATQQVSQQRLEQAARTKEKSYHDLVVEALAREQEVERQLAQQLSRQTPVMRHGQVKQGNIIGYMGATGFCYAEGYGFNTPECGHVHFEVIKNSQWTDPRRFVPGRLSWPLDSFRVTQEFGDNWRLPSDAWAYSRGHTGRDLVAQDGIGAPVRAAADGQLIELFPEYNGWMPDGYGCYKVIDHGDGLWTLYGHLTESSCKE